METFVGLIRAISGLHRATRVGRRFARATLALVPLVFGLSATVHAIPVTYTLVILGVDASATNPVIAGASGQLGNVYFGGSHGEVILTLTFDGDTSDVVPWSVPGPSNTAVSGYEIRKGTASVEIQSSATHAVLAQGTFDPTAGIFVSIDNVNLGIGFGSHAVWPPTAPNFPGFPAYPFGNFLYPSNFGGADDRTYDLKSNFDSGLVSGWSCVGFPIFPCLAPITLATSGGDLTINSILLNVNSYFHTTLHPLIAFASFESEVEFDRRDDGLLRASGRFKLGSSSNGINPLSEIVTLQINKLVAVLPASSFKLNEDGQYSFDGVINGIGMRMQIRKVASETYSYSFEARVRQFVNSGAPTTIALTIGDDSGSTTSGSIHDD
ncbi:MAG: hypothetical protein ACYDAH_17315 [Steroidobacteraceae bacterium]